jgi:hypothetical protein
MGACTACRREKHAAKSPAEHVLDASGTRGYISMAVAVGGRCVTFRWELCWCGTIQTCLCFLARWESAITRRGRSPMTRDPCTARIDTQLWKINPAGTLHATVGRRSASGSAVTKRRRKSSLCRSSSTSWNFTTMYLRCNPIVAMVQGA